MNKRQKRELRKLIISLFLFACLIIINDVFNCFGDNNYIRVIIYGLVYIFISYEIIIKAFKNIFSAQFLDENFLMVLATLGAFILSEYNEALAVILFYQVGEFFQSYAVNKSRKSISNLMELAPEYANLIYENEIKEIDLSEVKINDILLVKPGEKIPVDGVVVDGETSLDVRALTGESIYKDVSTGDIVLSGMINTSGTIKIKAEKEYIDSTASKILELVESASSVKSNPEKFITKFAKVYTPVVVALALLLAIVPSIITGDYTEWIYRALNFLVVSCPCALVISIPLTFFTGIGKASKIGILIKGSSYIEKFNNVSTFVFDKTGTITKGNFVVSKVMTNVDEEELFRCAVIAESNSNHPIACSIKNYYIERYNISEECLDFQINEIAGKGIIASKNGEEILCGNKKLMIENGVEIFDNNEIGTSVHVAKNKKYLGTIIISDEVKDNAKSVINFLNENNYHSIILSGDNEKIVKAVKKELNITDAYSSLLPNEKLEKLDEIKNKYQSVCFIGDGINDAPSLIKADIGISMGLTGSDAAIESSDIVIMDDNLDSIVNMKKLSKVIMRIVYQNIILALGVKILVLILSAVGLSNMWLAIFADVGVAVIAILNALRVSMFKNKKSS